MKFENLYIKCESMADRNNVISIATSNGYKRFLGEDNELGVVLTDCGKVFDLDWLSADENKKFSKINYLEFMQKYGSNTMIEKINQAKKQLNFNNKQLSEALGYSRQYITKMLNLPQSEKIQDRVCKEIDVLLDREKIKKTIASNSIQTRVDDIENPINEMSVLRFQNNCKDKDITALKKKLENNQVVINKLDDQLIRAEKVHNEDVKALQEAHSIIHVKNQRIEALEHDVFSKNIEIKDLNQAYIEVCDSQKWNKDRIVCERWLFLIIIAILSAVVIFK